MSKLDDAIEYPSEYFFKVVMNQSEDCKHFVYGKCAEHIDGFHTDMVTVKASSAGTFESHTITFVAQSQEHAQGLYDAIKDHPEIKMVL